MDLKQRKLNKSEWTSIEVSVPKSEVDILSMIIKGFNDVNIKINDTNSIFTFLKIEYSEKMEDYLYNKYLSTRATNIEGEIKKINANYKPIKLDTNVKINSADKVRLERFDENSLNSNDIYEFVLLTHMEKLIECSKTSNNKAFHYYYYTIYKLFRNNIVRLNRHIVELTNKVLNIFEDSIEKLSVIQYADEFIEKNESLLNKIFYYLVSYSIKIIPIGRIRRRLEYWYSMVIPNSYISEKINNSEDLSDIFNHNVVRRLLKYKNYGFEIFIISAGPNHFLKVFGNIFNVNVIGSKVIFGINVHDLMGNKIPVYKNIENNHVIISIYSDYIGDLYKNSINNYLVGDVIKKINL
jgi:hypothetical protein